MPLGLAAQPVARSTNERTNTRDLLGGTGLRRGELLRLLASHPYFDLAAVASDSQPDEPVASSSVTCSPWLPHLRFANYTKRSSSTSRRTRRPLSSRRRHMGVSAALIDRLLTPPRQAENAGAGRRSLADFRYASADAYETVYKHAHGAPDRISEFTCAVPSI